MYSPYVSFVLGSMVVTGAARSIVAKLFYQLGFEYPLFLTLLYLGGQAFSLVPYNMWRYCLAQKGPLDEEEGEQDGDDQDEDNDVEAPAKEVDSTESVHIDLSASKHLSSVLEDQGNSSRSQRFIQGTSRGSSTLESLFTFQDDDDNEEGCPSLQSEDPTNNAINTNQQHHSASSQTSKKVRIHPSESMHGLPDQSKTQHLVERIPWYIKPAVPAFFNLINSAMRWTSLLFVSASVAEMLISGMELILSVLATKCVRGRVVTPVRWVGVGVCTIGIILVGIFDSMHGANSGGSTEDENSTKGQTIGILLILGQSVMSVFQGKQSTLCIIHLLPTFVMMHTVVLHLS